MKHAITLIVALAVAMYVGMAIESNVSEATLAPAPPNIELESLSRVVQQLHNRTSYLEDQLKAHGQYSQVNRQLLQAQDKQLKVLGLAITPMWKLHNDPNEGHWVAPVVDANGVRE